MRDNLIHVEKKPEKKSEVHRMATCACFSASHPYATHASGRNKAMGFMLSNRIYRCVLLIFGREDGGIWEERRAGNSRYCTSGE